MLRELEPLVAQYARSRETLLSCVARLNATQVKELLPGRDWSVQDTLSHIATNEGLMRELLRDVALGTNTALPDDFDNQRFNDEQVAAGRSKSIEQLRAELEASYAQLVALLESFTPEMLNRRGTHPAAGDTNVKEFFLAMYAHHEVHCRDVVEQVRRLLKN
ncbi:MAG: DinB family protein [Chloroflexi bacterium]|nr:DinB family protein [Chloroflexota bacterium]